MEELQNKLKQEQIESHYHIGEIAKLNSAKALTKLNVIITIIMLSVIGFSATAYSKSKQKDINVISVDRFWRVFWKSVAHAEKKQIAQMNLNLNRLVNLPSCNSDRLNKALDVAERFESSAKLTTAISARIVLFENEQMKTAIDNMVKIKEENPKRWEKFINSQNFKQTNFSEKKIKKVAVTKSNT
tara:strand:+ start:730 stop:1287 length:558 start_codon:yes stop_codon:yes gene_type:complete